MTPELSREYIAGFFDGEGCVVIGKTGPREHELAVTLTNNNRLILDTVAAIYPGAVNKNRDSFIYRCGHAAAERFLRDIKPFVIVKATQVSLALEFRRTFDIYRKPLSDETLEQREWFYEELRRINGLRGRDDPEDNLKKMGQMSLGAMFDNQDG